MLFFRQSLSFTFWFTSGRAFFILMKLISRKIHSPQNGVLKKVKLFILFASNQIGWLQCVAVVHKICRTSFTEHILWILIERMGNKINTKAMNYTHCDGKHIGLNSKMIIFWSQSYLHTLYVMRQSGKKRSLSTCSWQTRRHSQHNRIAQLLYLGSFLNTDNIDDCLPSFED